MEPATVVVVGAVNVDLVVAAPRLPGPGETVIGPTVERLGGGKGANAAVAAARAGATVQLVGAVGADEVGRGALDELRVDGVGVDGVAVLDDHPTGLAMIVVDPAGENQIAVAAGANAALPAAHVEDALAALLPSAGCVLVSAEIAGAALLAAVRAATAAGVPCILNPAPVTPTVLAAVSGPEPAVRPGSVAAGAAPRLVLTPNATELLGLVPDGGPRRSAADRAAVLAGRTGAVVVVTLGAAGAVVVDGAGPARAVAAPAVAAVVDTTGAGDTFNGVLAAGLAAGAALDGAVRTAVVAASLSVAGLGARTAMPDAGAIAAALER